jgi:hypothetical protein
MMAAEAVSETLYFCSGFDAADRLEKIYYF